MTTSTVVAVSVTNRNEADAALLRLATLKRQIASTEGQFNAVIEEYRAKSKAIVDPLAIEAAALEAAVTTYGMSLWDKAVMGMKVLFNFGTINVSEPTGKLVFLKDEATTIKRIKKTFGKLRQKSFIRVTEAVNKNEVKRMLKPEQLLLIGAKIDKGQPSGEIELNYETIITHLDEIAATKQATA